MTSIHSFLFPPTTSDRFRSELTTVAPVSSKILTDLPAADDAFDRGIAQSTVGLRQALSTSDPVVALSPFAGVVLLASLFGRNLLHLHRPGPNDCEDDLNGDFWKRHREMDNILLHVSLSMPGHFRLPNGLADANIVFLNLNIHASTICLHQAAIFKADQNHLPPTLSAESKVRCVTAAAEIASIMRMIAHMDPAVVSSTPDRFPRFLVHSRSQDVPTV